MEGRLYDDKRKGFNVGDKITFFKEPEKVETIDALILNKYLFKSFDVTHYICRVNDIKQQEIRYLAYKDTNKALILKSVIFVRTVLAKVQLQIKSTFMDGMVVMALV